MNGRVALVTGGGSGIGKAIALLFASKGANRTVGDIKLPAAEQTVEGVKRLGREAIAIKADVGEVDDVDLMVSRVIKELGRLIFWGGYPPSGGKEDLLLIVECASNLKS